MSDTLTSALSAYVATVPVQRAEKPTPVVESTYVVMVPNAEETAGIYTNHTDAVTQAESLSRSFSRAVITQEGVVVAYYVRGVLGTWQD